MNRVRPPAVAGQFYPANPVILAEAIQSYLDAVPVPDISADGRPPKALIVPHAGYIYSGPIAAHAYEHLRPFAHRVRRVVVLGPAHRVYFEGIAAPTVSGFETPLGIVPVDQEAIQPLIALHQVLSADAPHREEHSLEVQLPFLQSVLTDFKVIPLVVGDVSPFEVSKVIERLWGGEETVFVISSDLSHYHPYREAKQLDGRTCEAIRQLQPDVISDDMACGRTPLKALLQVAERHALRPDLLDYRNSGDTAGSRDRVVGYSAFIFEEQTH